MNDSRYEDYNEDEEDEEDDDDDDTNDSDEDEDSYNSDSHSDHSVNSDEDWDVAGDPNYACNDSDEERFRKSTFKLCLDQIEYSPYLAINNQKLLKWKFIRGDETKSPGIEAGLDTCSFKIYQSVSKNFPSAFYLVDELIDQLSIKKFQRLNEIWSYLIKVSCAQVFNYRLKVFSLLIKILHKVLDEPDMDKKCINLFNLKPLKSLQVSLESPTNKDDRNLLRALYDLFFVADKLAIKWSIEREYQARLKSREEIIERLCEVSYFIGLIQASFGDNRRKQEALSVEPCPLETNVQRIWSNADTGSDEDDRTYESCDESATNSGGSGGGSDCLGDDVEDSKVPEENSEINKDSSENTGESST